MWKEGERESTRERRRAAGSQRGVRGAGGERERRAARRPRPARGRRSGRGAIAAASTIASPRQQRRGVADARTCLGRAARSEAHLARRDLAAPYRGRHKVELLIVRHLRARRPPAAHDDAVRLRPREQLRVAARAEEDKVGAAARREAPVPREAHRVGGRGRDRARPRAVGAVEVGDLAPGAEDLEEVKVAVGVKLWIMVSIFVGG